MRRGLVLVLPSGSYTHRAPHEDGPVLDFLAEHGVHAAVVDHAVAPHRHPTAFDQVLTVLADVRDGVHGARSGPLAVLGFSAGGHLAGLVGTATDDERAGAAARTERDPASLARPDAMVLCYPVASLVHHPHLGSRAQLLGAADTDARAAALSIENRVDAGTPAAFLRHTAAVHPSHSTGVVRAMLTAGVPVGFHLYPEGRHGLGLGTADGPPGVEGWTRLCVAWLRTRGIGRGAQRMCEPPSTS